VTDSKQDQESELTQLFCLGRSGDANRYRQFLTEAAHLLRRKIRHCVAESDVEDVLQETLMSIHKASHTFDGDRPLMPWLYAIASFRINDYLQRHYTHTQNEMDIAELADTLVVQSPDDGMKTDLVAWLKNLSERNQAIFKLVFIDGYTMKEAAKAFDMKESAVKVMIHRQIKHIRQQMGVNL
jgi:RNA polymerase sigma-70 factor (ECF subfamily)